MNVKLQMHHLFLLLCHKNIDKQVQMFVVGISQFKFYSTYIMYVTYMVEI